MQGLIHLYNSLYTQIQSTQHNLNVLYRRMEIVERALVERLTLSDTPSHTPSNTPSNTLPSVSYIEDPYYTRSNLSHIPLSRNRHVMSFDASSTDTRPSFSTNTDRPRDNVNIRFIRSPTSEESLSSAIFEDIILAFLSPSASDQPDDTSTSGVPEPDMNTCLSYNEFGNIDMPTTTTCPITMEKFEPTTKIIRLNVCGHIFSEVGILPWLSIRRHCPVCRSRII